MDIKIFGFNDRCRVFPSEFNNIEKSYLLLSELPVTQETASSIFSLLNSKNEEYFSSKNDFTNYVNNQIRDYFGFNVNPMVLDLMYSIKDKYEFNYPVGCMDDFNYKNPKIDDIIRFNRSVTITNNCLNILNTYEKTIKNKEIESELFFEKIKDKNELKNLYIQGKKTDFLEKILNSFFIYSGSKDYATPSLAKNVLKEMINVDFKEGNNKIYINPLTFNKVFYKLKKGFDLGIVNIIVGEPHRLFLEHFLSNIFLDVSSESFTLDILKTNKNTDYVKNDIKIAELENLIKIN